MCHSSPARILRNIKRITKFIERKSIFKPVLSVTILDQINIYPTSQNVLTAAKSISLSCQTIEQIDILPGADCDGSLIRSEFYPYCPECDKTYKREQVMLFREHCRVIHDWLWCKNWSLLPWELCTVWISSYNTSSFSNSPSSEQARPLALISSPLGTVYSLDLQLQHLQLQ